MPPRGPLRLLCVVVVTTWLSAKGLGTTPAATRPLMWAMSDIKKAPTESATHTSRGQGTGLGTQHSSTFVAATKGWYIQATAGTHSLTFTTFFQAIQLMNPLPVERVVQACLPQTHLSVMAQQLHRLVQVLVTHQQSPSYACSQCCGCMQMRQQ